MSATTSLWAALLLILAAPTWAQKAAGHGPKIDAAFFARKVQPILEKRCLGCHGASGRLSGLDLRSREAALKGGNRGPALVPGDASRSRLYRFAAGLAAPTMPPQGKLAAAERETLRRWIDAGAPWADGALSAAARPAWWSLAPVAPSRGRGIDTWVRARLRRAGLTMAPPADRRTLIRRVTLDLTGLPPTPEEVDAFLADKKPGAYERIVDRLLASPDYGEKWGRHWLDLARYADSGGFEGDKDRPLMYRYRDWVIDAFNRDLPYDRFVQDQVAGDELRPGDNDAWIATGYLACGPQDIVEKNARTRANELDDLVATTGTVVLGLTVGCARCHDHKYDPVSQRDYYRLSAVFAPTERREVDIPTPDERRVAAARDAEVEAVLAPLRQEAAPLQTKGEAAAKAAGQAMPTPEQVLAALPETERATLAALQEKIRAQEARRIPLPKAQAVTDTPGPPAPAHLLIRGDADHPGPVVAPGFIACLPGGDQTIGAPAAGAATTGRRAALARWLTRPDNPLTARVWVNRVWMHHFGHGIVDTPSNFGTNGDLPSHPELLDELAAQFVAGGWRLKPLQRRIVLSQTYRQSSRASAKARATDPQNRLLSHMPLRRLEGETIRDGILAVAGSLNRARGGPAVYPPVDPTLRADTFQGMNWPEAKDTPDTWRRSVYVKVKRSLLLPQLEVFDCPEITYTVAKRNITTTPLQALTLLNDPLVLRQAGLFAQRLERERPGDRSAQVERAWRLALARRPTATERAAALAFLKRRPLADLCHAVLNLNEFVYVP